MKVVVKIGGAQLDQVGPRHQIAQAVAAAVAAGHDVTVVHGGGAQLERLTDRLGMPAPQRVRGLRVTDPATAEAALMVLGGSVNRALVQAIGAAGVPAVGLTGADGGLFAAHVLDPALGLVGTVAHVDPSILATLHAAGCVPVVATMAPLTPDAQQAQREQGGDPDAFYNINADQVVAPLAAALGADAVLFLTDIEGVRGADGERLSRLAPDASQGLVDSGVIAGGMIPKVEAAWLAAQHCPTALVRIAPAGAPDAVLAALAGGGDVGTTFAVETHHG